MKIEVHIDDVKKAYKILLRSGYDFVFDGDYCEINEAQKDILEKKQIRFCKYRRSK